MKKKTVWIIGGSSGLGLATAKAFAADGWLVISGARSFGGQAQGDGIQELHLDVTDAQSRDAFVKQAFQLSERVDALVYCAAILILSPCELTSYEDYSRVMQTNFLGMTAFVSEVLPTMRKQQNGKIVLFSSINGLFGHPVPKRLRGFQARRGRLRGMPGDGVQRLGRPGIADRARRSRGRQPENPVVRFGRCRVALPGVVSVRCRADPRRRGQGTTAEPVRPGRTAKREP